MSSVISQQRIKLCITLVTGSLQPVRALEMEVTSVPPVSLDTLASTVKGKDDPLHSVNVGPKLLNQQDQQDVQLKNEIFFFTIISCAPGYIGNPQARQKCRPNDGKVTSHYSRNNANGKLQKIYTVPLKVSLNEKVSTVTIYIIMFPGENKYLCYMSLSYGL